MEFNPIENAARNDACPACKANKFMIQRLQESLKDDKNEMNSYRKRNMAMQKEEIMALKTKCKHLEDVVAYYKSNSMNNEGENSVNYDSVNLLS